ncbi:MAG: 8-amino-7-oxononanoate synthase [Acidobacteria bacterium]|nr:8-amino-7-oxononanoate synthase [Acidobacteriota bacterium]
MSSPGRWTRWTEDQIDHIHRIDQWRAPRSFDAAGPTGTLVEAGLEVVSFASNDYLGLTQHPSVRSAAAAAIERWGAGSGASRLVVGSRPVHHELEEALAHWRRTEAAIVFPTGFAANLGVLATFGQRGVHIFSDALNHASIVDGCRLARANGAEIHILEHLDLDALDAGLRARTHERCIVVTDVAFSMDGDIASVPDLIELCTRHDALLVLDEAHSVLQEVPTVGSATVLQVGTLSKTLGAVGGFVAGPQDMIDLLVNRARSYIFTTAPSPADAAAARAALAIVDSTEGEQLRSRLRMLVDRIRPGHPTPIIPVVLGDERAAVGAAEALLARGLLVPAIRPPSVPAGASRLRIALSAIHTDDQIDRLRDALDELALTRSDR